MFQMSVSNMTNLSEMSIGCMTMLFAQPIYRQYYDTSECMFPHYISFYWLTIDSNIKSFRDWVLKHLCVVCSSPKLLGTYLVICPSTFLMYYNIHLFCDDKKATQMGCIRFRKFKLKMSDNALTAL